jgi:hypothetical protein
MRRIIREKQEYYRWSRWWKHPTDKGVDDAEFSPLPEEESPRSSPGGGTGNLLLNKVNHGIPISPVFSASL